MIILRARIPVESAHREQVRQSLAWVIGSIRVTPGCLSCGLFQDMEDQETLLYIEEWNDMPSLLAHIKSYEMRAILSSVDFASRLPQVNVLVVGEVHGLEFIASTQAPA